MTQKQLGKAVDTSQQQIQRIEVGAQVTRYDLALEIADALGVALETAFPGTKKPMKSYQKRGDKAEPPLLDKKFRDEMNKAGVDIDLHQWQIEFRLKGGIEDTIPISSQDKMFLFRQIQNRDPDNNFTVFDSGASTIVLNLDHLIYCKFLFDHPDMIISSEKENHGNEVPEMIVTVYTSDKDDPYKFHVEPDDYDCNSPEGETAEFESIQFQYLRDIAAAGLEENEMFNFIDGDGEMVFFRASDVAMIMIPIAAVKPGLLDSIYENVSEENPTLH